MFYIRTIDTSYMAVTLSAPDFVIFYICRRNKNREKAKRVSDSAIWVSVMLFVLLAGI